MAKEPRTFMSSLNALLFLAGLEITHNIFGDNCSSPQTTELRVGNKEGGGAAEGTLMKWVHLATGKSLVLTGLLGVFSGNWFAFLGSIVGTVDMQASYWYAKKCGRRLGGQGEYGSDGEVPVGSTNGTGEPFYVRP